MDAAQALADLTEISSQIEAAVLFSEDGAVLASTLADGEAPARLVRGAQELLEGGAAFRSGGAAVTQLEASTPDGGVFVVRDGARGIVATTAPQPTAGLVFYDLKSCLRSVEEEPPKPRRRRSAKAAASEEADGGA
ncbi:MAG TPA: roadblock/LC7 domain-containing protein [Gaiellaceae bacterium]|nr:roadblock/LC7 domain-containing protein [Gaiellaceae bacterium]